MNIDDRFIRLHFTILGSMQPNISTNEQNRIRATCSLVPRDWNSILDVGCGDGRVGNFLVEQGYRVIGADWSPTSLAHCKFDRFICDIRALWPLADSFDGVICAEVLEHLPHKEIESVLASIRSHSKHGFIISVPAREPMEAHMIACQNCHGYYHCWGHLHYFERFEDLDRLVGARAVERTFVPYRGVRSSALLARWRRALGYQVAPSNTVCPYCGERPKVRSNGSFLKKSLTRCLNGVEVLSGFLRPQSGWFICRYEV